MSTRGDMRALLRGLQRNGHRAEVRRSGHVVIWHWNGKGRVVCAATPSDHRAMDNLRSELRRQGF
jgi:hypothetical protein